MQAVFQVSDLTPEQLAAHGAHVPRLAVLGNPIAHSKSPQMQQAALDAAALQHSYIRLLVEPEAAAFAQAVQQLRMLGFIGCNVTIPFKKNALQLANSVDALSQLCGAANTLIFRPDGICAANTDGPGFARAVEELCGRPPGDMRVLILGACGGAGSALAAQCALSSCPELTLVNRPRPELEALRQKLSLHTKTSIRTCTFGSADLRNAVQDAELIVNATSLGLHEGDALPLPIEWLRPGQFIYDIVTHGTPFSAQAAAQGCITTHGLNMLLWQGAYAFEHWFGFLPDVEAMRRALH